MDAGTILTSTVVATVVSGFISGLYSLYAKQREYVNDYYGLILKRRITAYEELEHLIVAIKTAVVDEDIKPYHSLFAKDDDWHSAYDLIGKVTGQALWLSAEAFKKAQELNDLFFHLDKSGGAIAFGKANYEKIANLRAELEGILADDLLYLHNVKRFLKRKRSVESGFRGVKVKR